MVVDIHGKEIKSGQVAVINYDSGREIGLVYRVSEESPTVNQKGYWIDIIRDADGPECVPSYIVAVIDINESLEGALNFVGPWLEDLVAKTPEDSKEHKIAAALCHVFVSCKGILLMSSLGMYPKVGSSDGGSLVDVCNE